LGISAIIKKANADDDILSALKELRIITYNYPILIAYIMMHPCSNNNEKTIPFIDYLMETFTSVVLEQ
jgi:hypothetical protein